MDQVVLGPLYVSDRILQEIKHGLGSTGQVNSQYVRIYSGKSVYELGFKLRDFRLKCLIEGYGLLFDLSLLLLHHCVHVNPVP